jgi:regulator of protease activity HflC (stomatin/prohibitin superfamily)
MSDDIEEEYVEEANSRRFHRQTVAVLLLIVLLIASILLWNRMVVSIRSGESGVLYRFFTGTEMEQIYDEGVHLLWPWDRMFIYDMRLQTKEREYSLLTSSGLPVLLNVAVRYRPDIRMLPLLHVAVGPEYLEKVVFPETEAVLRRAVGQYGPEEVYTSKRGFLESIVVSSLSKVESRYILIDDVLVKSVDLPPLVRDAIDQKLVLGEQEKAYEYRLAIEHKEAERKKIEAGGIQEYQRRVGETLTQDLLRWQGIQATRELATSNNAKTVVIGAGKDGLPIILGDR